MKLIKKYIQAVLRDHLLHSVTTPIYKNINFINYSNVKLHLSNNNYHQAEIVFDIY